MIYWKKTSLMQGDSMLTSKHVYQDVLSIIVPVGVSKDS